MNFFNGFNFDTLLALISCVVSIISLFISKDVQKKYKEANKLTVKKTLKDDSEDYSINVSGTYNAGIKKEELETVIQSMATMNKENFSTTLNKAYLMFQTECKENLYKITEETKKIIEEERIDLSGYTKIDWIHVFFEAAKNTSDMYMQNIWARVLAKELSEKDSISYKTIDTLKNMSANEFKMFEKICSLRVIDIVCKGDYLEDCGLNWMNLQKMHEYGMICLDNSQRSFNIESKKHNYQIINNDYAVVILNNTDKNLKREMYGYPLTNVANELKNIVNIETNETDAIKIANTIQKNMADFTINLYKIKFIDEKKFELMEKIF